MLERFQGDEGRRRLVEALKKCPLVEHNEALATKLAEGGELVTYLAGDTIVMQGGTDNDIFIILVGEADVYLNLRFLVTRGPYQTIGEMAAIEPTAPRSATVNARSEIVALKVPEETFHRLADEFPHVWKVMAQVIAERLRQRATFTNLPNPRPVLFLGSSVENLHIAEEIALGFKHSNIDAVPWTKGIFGPGAITLDALMKAVDEADFAAFVFGPEDKVVSRGTEFDAPRDNIVFELGLFMGKLDRNRTFIIKEQHTDIKIPSDLLGITPLTYIYREGVDLAVAMGPVCTELKKTIQTTGVR